MFDCQGREEERKALVKFRIKSFSAFPFLGIRFCTKIKVIVESIKMVCVSVREKERNLIFHCKVIEPMKNSKKHTHDHVSGNRLEC